MPPPPPINALPLHLTLSLTPWLASLNALSPSKPGSQALSMPWLKPGSPLAAMCENLQADSQLARAVQSEAANRTSEFLAGVRRYRETPFVRRLSPPDTVAVRGASKLLCFGAEKGRPAVFLIPSLINRYHILDLTQRLSFARFLAERGFAVYTVDWGVPGEDEKTYDCSDYIAERLLPFSRLIRDRHEAPFVLAGYCMGGVLALGLACLEPTLCDGLACFATPWDFAVKEFPHFPLDAPHLERLLVESEAGRVLPTRAIDILFHYANPYAYQAKLREFGRMDSKHPAMHEILATQHWANDGMPMTEGVARECLLGWIGENVLARGAWKVKGVTVSPEQVRVPSFLALAGDDVIVPLAAALPLAERLPRVTVAASPCGHIGMMVGRRRRRALWEPFVSWLDAQFPSAPIRLTSLARAQ